MPRALAPTILAISDRKLLPAESISDWVTVLAHAGVDTLQIREKDLDDRSLFELVERACTAAAGRIRIVVNGRMDVALAAGACGVHLPTDGIDVSLLRQHVGHRLLIGCSTHHEDEVAAARDAGADYVTFGPVWDTPSKRPFGQPAGLERLRQASMIGVPVLALGGVRADRLQELADSGAAGFAAIRALHPPSDLATAVRAANAAWPPNARPDTLAPSTSEHPGSQR